MVWAESQQGLLGIKEFERLFYRLQPRLYAYCHKFIDNNEQAKDIVQECFVNLWDNRTDIITSYEAYLFKAVHNRCISHFRSLKVRADYESSVKQKMKEIEISPEVPYPLTELYLKEINEILHHCVKKLPERCQLVFVKSRYQGMKNQEIADELDISVRTVDAQIYHALKTIMIVGNDAQRAESST